MDEANTQPAEQPRQDPPVSPWAAHRRPPTPSVENPTAPLSAAPTPPAGTAPAEPPAAPLWRTPATTPPPPAVPLVPEYSARSWPDGDPTSAYQPASSTHGGRPRAGARVLLLAAVLGAVGTAAIGVPVYVIRSDRAAPAPTPKPSPTPVDPTPTPDPLPTEEPMPTATPPATVDASTVADHPDVIPVATTLGTYFDSVDNRDFTRAYDVYTPEWRARNSYAAWSNGVSTTDHSDVRLVAIAGSGIGETLVTVTFTSTQEAAKGTRPGETCTHWSLLYTLRPNPDGEPPYRIAGARKTGFGSAPC